MGCGPSKQELRFRETVHRSLAKTLNELGLTLIHARPLFTMFEEIDTDHSGELVSV